MHTTKPQTAQPYSPPALTRGRTHLQKLSATIKKTLFTPESNRKSTLPYVMNKFKADANIAQAAKRVVDLECEITGGGNDSHVICCIF